MEWYIPNQCNINRIYHFIQSCSLDKISTGILSLNWINLSKQTCQIVGFINHLCRNVNITSILMSQCKYHINSFLDVQNAHNVHVILNYVGNSHVSLNEEHIYRLVALTFLYGTDFHTRKVVWNTAKWKRPRRGRKRAGWLLTMQLFAATVGWSQLNVEFRGWRFLIFLFLFSDFVSRQRLPQSWLPDDDITSNAIFTVFSQ